MIEEGKSGRERLAEIAKQRGPQAFHGVVDWEKRKQDWLGQLSSLYGQIGQWLADIDGIRIQRQPVWISEEFIGNYQADRLLVYAGEKYLAFTPTGALVLGARGRVDLFSSINGKRAKLILLEKGNAPGVWTEMVSEFPSLDEKSQTYGPEWVIVKEDQMKKAIFLTEESFITLVADLLE
jgi:hypothetical protein